MDDDEPDPRTIRCLELRVGMYAEKMIVLCRRHVHGENVAAEIKQLEASIDIVEALVGGLRRDAHVCYRCSARSTATQRECD